MRTRSRGPLRTGTTAGTVRRTGKALTLALAAVLLAGCSASGDAGDASAAPSNSSSASPSASPSGSSSTASDSPSGSAVPSAAAQPGGTLASKTFSVTTTYAQLPASIRLDLVSLQRRDDLLQLVAHLTNTSTDRSKDMRWQVGNRFDPGTNREDLAAYNGIFGGVVLTDVANKKRYLVAADSAKDCVCTSDLSGTFLGAGQSVELVATYAAPPASTTALDVEVPGLGLFRDVPVS